MAHKDSNKEPGTVDSPTPTSTYHYLTDSINSETVEPAIEFILNHNINGTKEPITLIINNYGGELAQMLALVDIMKGSKVPVHTVGTGIIASAATFIFMAGEKGYRTLTQHAIFMTHQLSGGSEGKYHELLADMKYSKVRHEQMIGLYSELSGLSKEDVKKLLVNEKDHYLTARQALKLGLCDKVESFRPEKRKHSKEIISKKV